MLLVPIDFIGHRYTGDTDDSEIVNINRKKALERGTAIGNGHRTELAFITVHQSHRQSYIHSKKERKRNTAIAFIFTQTCSRRLSNASVVIITHRKSISFLVQRFPC